MTQDELAAGIHTSRSSIGDWEDLDRVPRGPSARAKFNAWALACGVSADWIEFGQLPRVDSNHEPAGSGTSYPALRSVAERAA